MIADIVIPTGNVAFWPWGLFWMGVGAAAVVLLYVLLSVVLDR